MPDKTGIDLIEMEELFPIEVNINKFFYNEENLFILLIRDITKEKEVEKMNGSIGFEPEYGKRTIFYIEFPLV